MAIRLRASLFGPLMLLATCSTAPSTPTPEQAPAQAPAQQAAAAAAPAAPTMSEELRKHNEHEVQELLEKIAGSEEKPAEEVFKNIQMMKGVPAGRLLRIMNAGFSTSLGVHCDHCHVEDRWEADEKRPKLAAREMMAMTRQLNEQLKSLKNLDGEATVNCATCHRGQVVPATTVGR